MNRRNVIIISACLFSLCFTLVYSLLFSMLAKESAASTFYMNQVGLYKEAKNVEQMQKKLANDGLDAYTLKQGELTAVICGISEQKKELEQVQELLKKKSYRFVEKSVQTADESIKQLIEEGSYQKALERMGQ